MPWAVWLSANYGEKAMADNRDENGNFVIRAFRSLFGNGIFGKDWDSYTSFSKGLVFLIILIPFFLFAFCALDGWCLPGKGLIKLNENSNFCQVLFCNSEVRFLSADSIWICRWKIMAAGFIVLLIGWALPCVFLGFRNLCRCCLWAGKIEGWLLAFCVSMLTLSNYLHQLAAGVEPWFHACVLIVFIIVFALAACKLGKFWRDKTAWNRFRRAANRFVRNRYKDNPSLLGEKKIGLRFEKIVKRKTVKGFLEISFVKGFVDVFFHYDGLDEENKKNLNGLMNKVAEEMREELYGETKNVGGFHPLIVPWRIEDASFKKKSFERGEKYEPSYKWRIVFSLEEVVYDFRGFFEELDGICGKLWIKLEMPEDKKQDVFGNLERTAEEKKASEGVMVLNDSINFVG